MLCKKTEVVYPLDLGTCDCAGNVLDAVGVCGGECASDTDGDRVCDDEDECIGVVDACGVCNGPGAVYACGCGDVPEGDCDCNGSQLDACGICGGDGTTCVGCTYEFACNYDPEATISDASLCEFGTCPGCTSPSACNFNPTVSEDDGTCEWCSCIEYFVDEVPGDGPYGLVVESSPAVQAGLTTYRVYVSMVNATDRLSSVYGNDDDMLSIDVPDEAFNSALNASWSAVGLSNALVASTQNWQTTASPPLGWMDRPLSRPLQVRKIQAWWKIQTKAFHPCSPNREPKK